jgi:HlyD family secretion protein
VEKTVACGKTLTPNGRPASGEAVLPGLRAAPRGRWWWIAFGLLLLLLAIAAGVYFAVRSRASLAYAAVPVARHDLTQSVSASGTVNAQNTVLVGTQVSGTIQSLYVDFNSRVRKGQVLARLDPSQFQAQVTQAQATLAQARAQAAAARQQASGARSGVSAANAATQAQGATAQAAAQAVAAADANVVKSQSVNVLAQQTLARDRKLLSQGYIPQSQYDADYSSAVAAQTSLNAARAAALQTRSQAQAGVSQVAASSAQAAQSASQAAGSVSSAQAAAAAVQTAQAVLEQDRVNLARSIITSPVDGTVVARNVSVGQTVAASFQTPTLFTIAQDLRKMEVDIGVGEPDIGNVRPGNAVDFSVLAYPNQTFHGKVSQVRVNPTTVQNVVTYTVIVLVENRDNRLLPGMTANANIGVTTKKNALVVPTQALTYRPSTAARQHAQRSAATTTSPWGQAGPGTAGAVVAGSRGVLFVLREGKTHAVQVRVDLVSGTQAAVTPVRGALDVNDAVITSDSSSAARQRSSGGNAAPGFGRMIH